MQQAGVVGVSVCVARAEPAMGGCDSPSDAAPRTDAWPSGGGSDDACSALVSNARKGSLEAGTVWDRNGSSDLHPISPGC